jgi:diguanylate cyclase (GGDEF)-like protein/PAS domain S-box-containing protein
VHRSDLTSAELGLQTLPGESDGQMWMRHIPAEHHERMKRISRAALRSGAPGYQQEFRFLTANQTELWLKEDVKITRVAPGEYHLVGVCLDVTERRQAEKALSEVVASARCILWDARVTSHDGRYQWRFRLFNSDLIREEFRLQRLPNETDADMWPRHIAPEQLEKMNHTFDTAIRSGKGGYQQEYLVKNDDNQSLWLKEDVRITRLSDSEYHLVGVCLDITDRKVMENELAKERDLLQALMDNIPDSVFFKDDRSRFIRINTHLAYRLGLKSPDEAAGRTDADFYAEDRAKEFLADDQEVLGGKRILNKTEWKLSGGSDRWSLTSKVPFRDRDGKVIGIVGVAKDITPLKRMEREVAIINERLHKLAREDDLTGLLNRRTILGQMESEWARWQRYKKAFSVLLLDADDFKLVNDRYGHLVGDQALKLLADTLRQSVRNVDSVGRYGGEEFIVLLPETGLDGARIAAEKILHNVRSANLRNNGDALRMTVSVGAAAAQNDDRNMDALLHRADVALYAAKSAGKNQVAAPA